MKQTTRRLVAFSALLALLAAGCSGSKVPNKKAKKVETVAGEKTSDEVSGITEASPTGDASSEGAQITKGGTAKVTTPVAKAGEKTKVVVDETGAPIANLFTAAEDKIGISATEIKLCLHAAFVLGDAFNNKKEDEDVYWRMLNASGGIFNRRVTIRFEDDKYLPDEAVAAATRCKDAGTFAMYSGVGFDQIPRVRQYAEDNRQLYFHSMATEDGAEGKNFSFASTPTLQMVGRQIAEYFLSAHPGKKVAIVYRNAPTWDGARTTFKSTLKAKGVDVVIERPVNNAQGSYATEISALKGACPANNCVVFANENVLNFAQLYEQAQNQPHNYRPVWFNYGFQLTNDTVGAGAASAPPLEAWYPTPAYDPTNSTNQPWWGEIQKMKKAYQDFCTGACTKDPSELNDVDWQFWVAFKAIHQVLLDCGPDCSKNRLVGMLLNGYKKTVDPLCEADFSRGARHFGAHKANIYQSVAGGSTGAVFKQIRTCQENF